MRRGKYSEEQIVKILREAERGDQTIGALCRAHGISEVTFYAWRKKFGGLSVPDVKRLREFEYESAQLKRLLADRDLEIDALKKELAKKW